MDFRHGSLRNPIVEKVLLETLRTVRDIWKTYGKPDEIHLELGREMKNTADKRRRISERNATNENANLRIRAMLTAFMNPEMEVADAKYFSPSQQDLFKIYESSVLESEDLPDDISEILKKFNESATAKRPSEKELLRYKCWLDQKYLSPYTGRPIPLSRLFTTDYQIEHVIPQSRYFDDSFNNKVICESAVNALKDRQTAHEFICSHGGESVSVGGEKQVRILEQSAYKSLVQEKYAHNQAKKRRLLMDDIPDEFIERQANDNAYISKFAKSLLSKIVRDEGEAEAVSKHLISCSGRITDMLKQDWGVNDVWNAIILPRFVRMEGKTDGTKFTAMTAEGHLIPSIPFEYRKGFNKKRIDHRHHAMDAIVIACATRDHVNLLNNEAAKSENKSNRYALQRKLRRSEKYVTPDGETRECFKEFTMPWPSFKDDIRRTLDGIVVSFKYRNRLLTKTSNHYQRYVRQEDGILKKKLVAQEKGELLAVRKSMHKETVFGNVNLRLTGTVPFAVAFENPGNLVNKEFKEKLKSLRQSGYDAKRAKKYFEDNKDVWSEVNLRQVERYVFSNDTKDRYYATRFATELTGLQKAKDGIWKKLDRITDAGISKILRAHLKAEGGDAEIAFSPEGIERMNANIAKFNGGKNHKPIKKVRKFEKANKFAVGETASKRHKYVEADDGTNLYLGVYGKPILDEVTGEESIQRKFKYIPMRDAMDRIRKGLDPVPEINKEGYPLLFTLSPGDLVYFPSHEERKSGQPVTPLRGDGIYKVVSCGSAGHDYAEFVPESVASRIVDKVEYTVHNKTANTDDGEQIQQYCIKLSVDRLGRVKIL